MHISLTDPQFDFITADEKFCAFIGGIGAGKSFVGAHFVRKKISEEHPEVPGLIGANTHRQLMNATLTTVFSVLDDLMIPYEFNQQKGILYAGGRKIFCYSLQNYEVIRGIQIGWFLLDETRDTDQRAWNVILGRLRHPKATKLEGRITSSPNGFDWMYERFAGEKKTKDFKLIQGSSMDNPYLPAGYLDSLKEAYTQEFYEQEVLAKFVAINKGRVYRNFDRTKHVKTKVEFNPQAQVWIGMDFNVAPMSAVVIQHYNNKIHIIDEFFMFDSGTPEMAEAIKEKYGKWNPVIIPDATGKAIKTSSGGLSDHEILRRKGFRVVSTYNPGRMDRYNAVNNVFEKNMIWIDSSCKNTIRDFEQVVYKEGSTHPDVSKNKELTHLSDAVGYAIWHIEPIQRPRLEVGLINR